MNDLFMFAAISGLVIFVLNLLAWILSGFDNKYSGKTLLGISIFLLAILTGSHLFGEGH